MTGNLFDGASEMEELSDLFWAELGRGLIAAAEAHRRLLGDPGDAAALASLQGFCHRLAGDAGSVGQPVLSSLGAACEALLKSSASAPDLARALRVVGGALASLESEQRTRSSPRPEQPRSEAAFSKVGPASEGKGHVLIVEDDPFAVRMMESALHLAGFETTACGDADSALARLEVSRPDLILTDVQLPSTDGFELCRRIRSRPMLDILPIIFVTARADVEERIRGLSVGGNDYLVKPFDPRELVARVSTHLQRISSLREMAIRDGLTHCYNQKYFKLRVAEELARAKRLRRAFSVAILDIDHFKAVNDRFGHLVGDAVLAEMANLVSASVRSIDLVARYGGEEFGLLLTETGVAEAAVLAARVLDRVGRHEFRPWKDGEQPPLGITVSIGIAEGVDALLEADALLERADGALYDAKRNGRNRVVVAP